MTEIDFDPDDIEHLDGIAADPHSPVQVLVVDGKPTLVTKAALEAATELAFRAAAYDAASRLPTADFEDFDARVQGARVIVTLVHASGATATASAAIQLTPTPH